MLSSVYHSGPVTALASIDGCVLAGIGSRLHVYRHWPTVQHTGTYNALPGSVVHGIRQEPHADCEVRKLCVFGQKSLRMVQFDPRSGEVKVIADLVQFCDWIWDVAWLKGGDKVSVALGHNVIVIWDGNNSRIVKTVHCTEKCILYCARFLTNQQESLILAAGTVFNQVVLWSPNSDPDQQGLVEPFHRLTGHQGVIFSVDYDPVSQRMCSVSDDRSIRLYQVSFPHTDNDGSLTDWENIETSLIHVLYGHSARVWDVKLMSKVFVSVGEDATCCVWNYDGKVIQKFKGHKGKSIWSIAVDQKEEFVVTGGGDSSIRLWNLHTDDSDVQVGSQTLELQITPEDFPRSVQFLKDDQVLVLTHEGILLQFDAVRNSSRCIMKDEKFASYSVLAVSPHGHMVAIGNIQGTLRLLYWGNEADHRPDVIDNVIYEGRVCSIIWLDSGHILTSGPDGEMNIWTIFECNEKTSLHRLSRFELPMSKHRWASAAALSQDMVYLICGDRAGSVMLYNMDGQLLQVYPRIHKADVTQVCLHGDQVYTTGRDGIYRMYEWGEDQLVLLNSSKVFKGFTWIERLIFTEDGDLLFQGFNANKFIVWSVEQNQKLIEVESGGGHRSWDFLLYGCRSNMATLLYIKAREVILKDIQLKTNQCIIKGCLHGRELSDVRHISSDFDESGKPVHILATCSEDTMVCLTAVKFNEHNQQDLQVLHSLSGHISSVRCLAVCESSVPSSYNQQVNRKLLFSAGGRAQIKIWRLDVNTKTAEQFKNFSVSSGSNPVSDSSLTETKGQTANRYLNIGHADKVKDNSSSNNVSSVIFDVSCDISEKEGAKNETNNSLNDKLLTDPVVRESPSQINSSHSTIENSESDCVDSAYLEKKLFSRLKEIKLSENMLKPLCSRSYCDNSNDQVIAYNEIDKGQRRLETSASCQYKSLAGVQLGCHKRSKGKPWRVKEDNSDPETRILDITIFSAYEVLPDYPEYLFFLTAACSDGLIRLFLFEEDSREVIFVASSNFHDHCVLKIKHVIHKSEHMPLALIVSAATDGRVAFWNISHICKSVVDYLLAKDKEDVRNSSGTTVFIEKKIQSQHTVNPDRIVSQLDPGSLHVEDDTENKSSGLKHEERLKKPELAPVCSLSCHQSGINSVFFGLYEVPDTYVLLTGGDDNAVHVSLVSIENLVVRDTDCETQVKVISSGSELSAHAAQITGIWYVGKNLLVTASIDQRICVWSFTTQESNVKLKLLECKFVDVPDIANIDIWRNGDQIFMAVCGEGIEILEINLSIQDSS